MSDFLVKVLNSGVANSLIKRLLSWVVVLVVGFIASKVPAIGAHLPAADSIVGEVMIVVSAIGLGDLLRLISAGKFNELADKVQAQVKPKAIEPPKP